MSNGETIYTARVAFPDQIERGRLQTIRLETYRDGAVATPSAGTVAVFDGSTEIVAATATVTDVDGFASYALPAIADTVGLSLGYRELWVLVMPDGVTQTFRREAWLVRRVLHPAVTQEDFTDVYSDLANLVTTPTTYFQKKIDAAWKMILGKLVSKGVLPDRIVSAWSLREVLWHKSLEFVFSDFHSRMGGGSDNKYFDAMNTHMKQFGKEWDTLNFTTDADGDGAADDPANRTAAESVIYFGSVPTHVRNNGGL